MSGKPNRVATYRNGPNKGLPKWCECGGKMEYAFSFRRVWSCCKTCTPVVKLDLNMLRPPRRL